MVLLQLLAWILLGILLPLLSFLFLTKLSTPRTPPPTSTPTLPRSFPIFGVFFSAIANRKRHIEWITDILRAAPSATYIVRKGFARPEVVTASPEVVQYILKTNFQNFGKGIHFYTTMHELLGDGIFNVDGEPWKFQRQVASHEFNTKSLRNFVENVVDTEVFDRLIPIISSAAKTGTVLVLQDILQRFAFDNICNIAFGYDPAYLLPSFPTTKLADAFEESVKISTDRLMSLFPVIWRIKKLLNIGSEKRLRMAASEVQEFARKLVREKKQELNEKSSLNSYDLLSRFSSSNQLDEDYVTDIVISFILAGRDTTSSALTSYFWLLFKHPHVESEVVKEIEGKSEALVYDEVKDMVYTHASLCESMRLYPPVWQDVKGVSNDDVLPGGIAVKKGMRMTYHPYAMGRSEKIWGPDAAEFKPERWLEKDESTKKWRFVAIRDAYAYPVFQAGPRICLGREMAFLQMKRVVAAILRQFKVVPMMEEGAELELDLQLTLKYVGGLPVKIMERV
ncbi:Cytochrome P450 94A2 [Morella rubra]|uniref:Cytochrome P450 94A2 n=1 Tax=Morella rubra TaxID=262757 RepID=A0A6A1V7Q2_9ROSI|nr:Cytochrome P450 94A2 [Morella rubra]